MPGANLPELTREITSIPRDASEYLRRPSNSPGDARLELREAKTAFRFFSKMQQCDFGKAFVFGLLF